MNPRETHLDVGESVLEAKYGSDLSNPLPCSKTKLTATE